MSSFIFVLMQGLYETNAIVSADFIRNDIVLVQSFDWRQINVMFSITVGNLGRTGTAVCAWLIASGQFEQAQVQETSRI